MKESSSKKGASKLLLLCHVLGVSVNTILVRYLTFYFGTFTLNFFRLSAGAIFLLSGAAILYRGELRKALTDFSLLMYMAALAVIATVAQCLVVEGMRNTSATLAGFMRVLAIVLSTMIAYYFFHDERGIVSSGKFKTGAVLALTGITGVILGGNNLTLEYSMGTVYLVAGMVLISTATVLQKRVATSVHPFVGGAIVSLMMSLLFGIFAFAWGDVGAVGEVRGPVITVLLFSGMFGVFVGLGLGFISIRSFGIIKQKVSTLAVPILVAVLSYFLLKEQLTGIQIVFGALLIGGCYLVIRARASAAAGLRHPVSSVKNE